MTFTEKAEADGRKRHFCRHLQIHFCSFAPGKSPVNIFMLLPPTQNAHHPPLRESFSFLSVYFYSLTFNKKGGLVHG
ncbi:hypothetical protein CHISP_3748 [Chitinispirillum alkaliphilum]|nr:hypothetical protein CHISP_3748 [Chitinispirillum alkaliphilum]